MQKEGQKRKTESIPMGGGGTEWTVSSPLSAWGTWRPRPHLQVGIKRKLHLLSSVPPFPTLVPHLAMPSHNFTPSSCMAVQYGPSLLWYFTDQQFEHFVYVFWVLSACIVKSNFYSEAANERALNSALVSYLTFREGLLNCFYHSLRLYI